MQIGQSLIPIEVRYPRIDVSVRRALQGVLDGSQDYTRADISVRQEFKSVKGDVDTITRIDILADPDLINTDAALGYN